MVAKMKLVYPPTITNMARAVMCISYPRIKWVGNHNLGGRPNALSDIRLKTNDYKIKYNFIISTPSKTYSNKLSYKRSKYKVQSASLHVR